MPSTTRRWLRIHVTTCRYAITDASKTIYSDGSVFPAQYTSGWGKHSGYCWHFCLMTVYEALNMTLNASNIIRERYENYFTIMCSRLFMFDIPFKISFFYKFHNLNNHKNQSLPTKMNFHQLKTRILQILIYRYLHVKGNIFAFIIDTIKVAFSKSP